MDADSDFNRKDIRYYIEDFFKDDHGVCMIPEDAVKTIEEKSEGLFLYIEHICPLIKDGVYSWDALNELPGGLYRIYEVNFERNFVLQDEKDENDEVKYEFYKASIRPALEVILAELTDMAYNTRLSF